MDAYTWAKEFMRIWGNRLSEVDISLMHAWFANAIMCGYDHHAQRMARHDADQRIKWLQWLARKIIVD